MFKDVQVPTFWVVEILVILCQLNRFVWFHAPITNYSRRFSIIKFNKVLIIRRSNKNSSDSNGSVQKTMSTQLLGSPSIKYLETFTTTKKKRQRLVTSLKFELNHFEGK